MKKIDLGQTITIFANLGVLVGILLLVYELSQNEQMMRAQTRNAVTDTVIRLMIDEADNDALQEISLKIESGESLSRSERTLLRRHDAARFRLWENVHYQYRQGLFDDSEYAGYRQAWRRILSRPETRELWCSRENEHSRDFVAEMDELLSESRCE